MPYNKKTLKVLLTQHFDNLVKLQLVQEDEGLVNDFGCSKIR